MSEPTMWDLVMAAVPDAIAELDREARVANPRSESELRAAQERVWAIHARETEARLRALEEAEAARQARLRVAEAALRDAGIEMSVDGCGCCGSPRVRLVVNGEVLLDEDDASFDTHPKP